MEIAFFQENPPFPSSDPECHLVPLLRWSALLERACASQASTVCLHLWLCPYGLERDGKEGFLCGLIQALKDPESDSRCLDFDACAILTFTQTLAQGFKTCRCFCKAMSQSHLGQEGFGLVSLLSSRRASLACLSLSTACSSVQPDLIKETCSQPGRSPSFKFLEIVISNFLWKVTKEPQHYQGWESFGFCRNSSFLMVPGSFSRFF